jgi:hypothetical protein
VLRQSVDLLAGGVLRHEAVVIDGVHKSLLGHSIAKAAACRVLEADAPMVRTRTRVLHVLLATCSATVGRSRSRNTAMAQWRKCAQLCTTPRIWIAFSTCSTAGSACLPDMPRTKPCRPGCVQCRYGCKARNRSLVAHRPSALGRHPGRMGMQRAFQLIRAWSSGCPSGSQRPTHACCIGATGRARCMRIM